MHQAEECFLEEGELVVAPSNTEFEAFTVFKGDFVWFPPGFAGTWEITKPATKRYRFVLVPPGSTLQPTVAPPS